MKNTIKYFNSDQTAHVGDLLQNGKYGPCRIRQFYCNGEAEVVNIHTKEKFAALISDCDLISRKKHKTKEQVSTLPVIFKMEGKGQAATPVAFFPTLPSWSSAPYPCTRYAHLGQHGSADTDYAAALKPATAEQYAPLLKELEQIGYKNLKPVRKFLRSHLDARKEALKQA